MKYRVFGFIVVLAAISAAVFFFFSRYHASSESSPVSSQSASVAAAISNVPRIPRTPPEGSREYASERFHFSFFYTTGMDVKEYEEGGGAATIAFQDVKHSQGFQLFIVPYNLPQVSAARFTQDIPSGVRKDVVTASVDGAVGAAFHSTDQMLGETSEVWFVKDGYLYELTAPRSVESLLDAAVKDWKFE